MGIRAPERPQSGVGTDGRIIASALEHMMLDKRMSTVAAASGSGGTGPGSELFWKRVQSVLAIQNSADYVDAVVWDLGKLLVSLEMCYRSVTPVTGNSPPLMSFDVFRRVFDEVVENSSSLERRVEVRGFMHRAQINSTGMFTLLTFQESRPNSSLFDACHVVLVDIAMSLTRSSEACVELSKFFVSMALSKSAFRRMHSMIVLDRTFSQVNSLRVSELQWLFQACSCLISFLRRCNAVGALRKAATIVLRFFCRSHKSHCSLQSNQATKNTCQYSKGLYKGRDTVRGRAP